MTDEVPVRTEDPRRLVNGARVGKRETQQLRRKLIPAMPTPADGDPNAGVKREAYAIAKAHRNKPWARRYLRRMARGFY